MKGKLLDFSIADGKGLISGDDGNRYTFLSKEWKARAHPVAGARVDFDVDGKTAVGVYVDDDIPPAKSSGPAKLDERYSSLYCSSDEKFLFGLCGGLAHKYGLPTAAMRLIVFLSLFFFVGWLYLVGIFLPKLPTKGVPRAK
jgi:phage shock protein PspC (stress-responsive transcriptional regulator)